MAQANYTPSLGDDVLFVLQYGPSKGQVRPAKVIAARTSTVDLAVFTNERVDQTSATVITVESVKYDNGTEPGTWHPKRSATPPVAAPVVPPVTPPATPTPPVVAPPAGPTASPVAQPGAPAAPAAPKPASNTAPAVEKPAEASAPKPTPTAASTTPKPAETSAAKPTATAAPTTPSAPVPAETKKP